ncbi:hypothetical protein SOVF_170030, partial [Spinacia oleracea]
LRVQLAHNRTPLSSLCSFSYRRPPISLLLLVPATSNLPPPSPPARTPSTSSHVLLFRPHSLLVMEQASARSEEFADITNYTLGVEWRRYLPHWWGGFRKYFSAAVFFDSTGKL